MLGIALALALGTHGAMAHAATDPPRVMWSEEWPRFRIWEGIATGGLTIGSLAIESKLSPPAEPNWRGGILLDDAARGLFRARSARSERILGGYSDVLYKVAVFFPYVDAALGYVIHRDLDVAVQMALIDAQSLALTGVAALFTERTVARARPYTRDCGRDQQAGYRTCGGEGDRESFFSGHSAATFTGAGLTCVHHQHLPLYGGGAPDTWACVWALSVATVTAGLRVASDAHYASDVLTGAAVGLASGYLLPSALHYGFGKSKPRRRAVAPLLIPLPSGIGAGVTGVF